MKVTRVLWTANEPFLDCSPKTSSVLINHSQAFLYSFNIWVYLTKLILCSDCLSILYKWIILWHDLSNVVFLRVIHVDICNGSQFIIAEDSIMRCNTIYVFTVEWMNVCIVSSLGLLWTVLPSTFWPLILVHTGNTVLRYVFKIGL